EAARGVKTFSKRERAGTPTPLAALTPTPLPGLTPTRNAAHTYQPVMPATRREGVMEKIDPSGAATVSRECLRPNIAEIIHAIVNEDRLDLSGREEFQLADEMADDVTGYGPLRPLLLDQSINDIMVNGPSNDYVGRKGKKERVARPFRDNAHIASV